MVNLVKTRPLRRMTQAQLDRWLEDAADILRGNVDHSEFRGYVFGLLFYKRISDVYLEEVEKLTEELGDEELARDPKMHNFIVPEGFLWTDPNDESKSVARTTSAKLAKALNEAMEAIEVANKPKFDRILTTIDFNEDNRLPKDKLVSLINHFSKHTLCRDNVPDDLFGNAYEYLIRDFASKAGKSSGEFYTPKEIAFLLAEILEPAPGDSICDWASGSGGLLLQCCNYVKKHRGNPNQLFLYAQESNLTTYNISRLNLILHGIRSLDNMRQGDSLRTPLHLDEQGKLMQFKRIVMNPPFSLKDWGYSDFENKDTKEVSDPYDRMVFGMPPRDNGDYAWLQHVVKSLKDDGKAIIVMSQGVLFRGQPEQTEEEDGQNQKADAEYLIREGFINQDLIECIVVLPPKLFYGTSLPGCLILLNKSKAQDRQGKILMIWASRNFQSANPQNLLRPSDLMRILVPWGAFGDLAKAQQLVGKHEQQLIAEVEAERTTRLQEIAAAYDPVLEPLPDLKKELTDLEGADYDAWVEQLSVDDLYFGELSFLVSEIKRLERVIPSTKGEEKKIRQEKLKLFKAEHREKLKAINQQIKSRLTQVKRDIKELGKLTTLRNLEVVGVNNHCDREVTHLQETAVDLLRICSEQVEARRYFTVIERPELEENEFSLNLPRYVDTFEPEETIELSVAIKELEEADNKQIVAIEYLKRLLKQLHLDG